MMNVAGETVPGHERLVLPRPVGTIRPDTRPRIRRVQQSAPEHLAVMARGIRDVPTADKAIALVDAGMRLVTKRWDRDVGHWPPVFADPSLTELDRPARAGVLLARFCRLIRPDFGCRLSFLDLSLLIIAIALLGRGNERGIHQLPGHGDIPGSAQNVVKTGEQRLDRPGFREPLPERPDRLRVGNLVAEPEAQEPHERQPVAYQELGPIIGEIVLRLDHEDLEQ